ncbi:hypothetical protein [Roseateles depolymerans]|uniref:Uncharacterized protein n=1 Tax=Roseateles depolymerans TaxID=76731 RepID=A0A0U3N5S7_9BURK|nr:hypothetical protein [Roseateles depolymerans]ALV07547.1 hypothetical protein RD2015_3086 [Roseateles depolymerans]REG22237.1 hypothetical protein DES44_1381 [Roseateles depolymerans]
MPSIRLTPLQPTTFDLWRDRVLTLPRSTLIQEAAVERDATTGSLQTLTRRLVGDDPQQTLSSQLSLLTQTLAALLSDSRSGRAVSVAESAANMNLVLGDQGPLATALHDCATALNELAADDDDDDEDDEDDPGPSEAATPDENGLVVLASVDRLRHLLLDGTTRNGALNRAMEKWRKEEISGRTGELLKHLDDGGGDWLDRFMALGDPLAVGTPALLPEDRRERLGQLIAFEYDVTLVFHEPDAEEDNGSTMGLAD